MSVLYLLSLVVPVIPSYRQTLHFCLIKVPHLEVVKNPLEEYSQHCLQLYTSFQKFILFKTDNLNVKNALPVTRCLNIFSIHV